jgi:hypothetical protein
MTDGYLAKFEGDCNIGVALGDVSNGLVSIDLDEDRYVDCLLEANPLFATTLRTRASRGCNIWLRCSGSYPSSRKLKDLSKRGWRMESRWLPDYCQWHAPRRAAVPIRRGEAGDHQPRAGGALHRKRPCNRAAPANISRPCPCPARDADIGDPAEPRIIQRTKHHGRDFHNQRAIRQIQKYDYVRGGGIGC